MKKALRIIGAFIFMTLFSVSCTDLEEKVYSSIVRENFYQSANDIYAVLAMPYQRISEWNAGNPASNPQAEWPVGSILGLNEMSADQVTLAQKWIGWDEGGVYTRIHRHTWTPSESVIYQAWNLVFKSIGFCNNAIEDLSALNYADFGLSEEEKKLNLAELKVLRALFQLKAMDTFGNVPICTNITDIVGNSTLQQNFDFIKQSILENISQLPISDASYKDRFTQAAAAVILMRLYFNAETYIGTPMYTETKKIAQDIIDGVYGNYQLDDDWNDEFCAENSSSKALIFSIDQSYGKNFNNSEFTYYQVFGFTMGIWNAYRSYGSGRCAFGLVPSRDPFGNLYPYKLGHPYESYSDKDMRKRQHVIDAAQVNGYTGMFMVGPQYMYKSTNRMQGIIEYEGVNGMVFVDQCATFGFASPPALKQAIVDTAYKYNRSYYEYPIDLPSNNTTQEFSSGVRLTRTPIYPDGDSRVQEGDDPVIRLEEVYYTLAECKFREGDIQGCVDLINDVRERAFAPADRAAEELKTMGFDKYTLLREWGCEFIGEGRRRTDLIRNNVFVEDEWWDKAANSGDYRKFFPIPLQIINANPLLEKSPGYSY
jgi:starch-binding outer membrane protein, SusD/RagB family